MLSHTHVIDVSIRIRKVIDPSENMLNVTNELCASPLDFRCGCVGMRTCILVLDGDDRVPVSAAGAGAISLLSGGDAP
jgi:hypothetical protein